MIPRSLIINYATNFLDEEIRQIKEMLNRKAISENDKKLLSKILQEYEQDLQELIEVEE